MRRGLYLQPFDLDALAPHGGLHALREIGFTDVAMATSYHAGRLTAPFGAGGPAAPDVAGRALESPLVRFLQDGVVHFRPRGSYGALQPQPSALVGAHEPLRDLLAGAAAAGLGTSAWTVLFHNTRLGELHPGSCVQNAFGDAYTYALCPARAEVQDFGAVLAADIAARDGLDLLELEAAGFMGWKHGSHHDKTSFPADAYGDFLLSYCFCSACRAGLAASAGGGVDADAARLRVRALLQQRFVQADLLQLAAVSDARARLEAELGSALLAAMLAHRQQVHHAFLERVRAAVPARVRLAVHLTFDPLATGSQMGQPPDAIADVVDEIVVTHYGEGADRIARAWQGRRASRPAAWLAFWPKPPELGSEDAVRRVLDVAAAAGCIGVRLYMLSLLPWRTVTRVARLLEHAG